MPPYLSNILMSEVKKDTSLICTRCWPCVPCFIEIGQFLWEYLSKYCGNNLFHTFCDTNRPTNQTKPTKLPTYLPTQPPTQTKPNQATHQSNQPTNQPNNQHQPHSGAWWFLYDTFLTSLAGSRGRSLINRKSGGKNCFWLRSVHWLSRLLLC